MDGSVFNYKNWRSGQPNNLENQDCVLLDVNGKWYDTDCSSSEPYICETPAP